MLYSFVVILLLCLVLVNVAACEEAREYMVSGPVDVRRSREFVLGARRRQYADLVRMHNESDDPAERRDISHYMETVRQIAREKGEEKRLLHGMPHVR